ncbi:hypothetical protein Clacol_000159 [Clathrus columnatus]|uniref:Uncharacterized protein n=1 Tax=Clathrus columnatus TaxID=1419009 RepID=A0AAV4ZWC7_9AGAM|nr:hypothetical protein Clacol_000159 [Clathrus columnatus]
MSSSSTSNSKNQSSSLPSASSSNGWNGVPQLYFSNVLEQAHNTQQTAFHSHFTPQTEDSSSLSSLWSLNDAAAVGTGMMYDSSADAISAGSSRDQERFLSEGWMTNQSFSTTNATGGFDLFNVPSIDNGGDGSVPPADNVHNGVFFENQYLPDFDFDFANIRQNNAPTGLSTPNVNVALMNLAQDNFVSNPGFGQRSNESPKLISMTGYAVQAAIPNFPMPSTSEVLNGDRTCTQWPHGQMEGSENVDPTIQSPPVLPLSTSYPPMEHDENKEVTSPRPSRNKKRYPKKILPSSSLYAVESGKYICRYKGPAQPEGCSIKSREVRYLCRHLRIHALRESRMGIPQEDWVAWNGMPEELLYLRVSCPFQKEADRGKCRYYRENGTVWTVKSLDRWEKVMDRHKEEYHDPGGGS